MKIRALSLWQPWASLIAAGAKQIETRSWSTTYRGAIAIHAAKRWTPEQNDLGQQEPFRGCLREAGFATWTDIPLGCVVGTADLIDVLPTELIVAGLSEQEKAFGNYESGRYGWVMANIRALPKPIPVRGRQGLWTLELEIEPERSDDGQT